MAQMEVTKLAEFGYSLRHAMHWIHIAMLRAFVHVVLGVSECASQMRQSVKS